MQAFLTSGSAIDSSDRIQECPNRCTAAAGSPGSSKRGNIGTQAFYIRTSDNKCGCSQGACSSHSGSGYHSYRIKQNDGSYVEVGSGHCVDSSNKRPPHCYTHDGSITDENTCKSACTAVSGCSAYEWGQTGGYCQLIWTTGISSLNSAQHSATTGSCSSSVLNNWKYNLNGDSGYSNGAIVQTYHNTGGKCYRKG